MDAASGAAAQAAWSRSYLGDLGRDRLGHRTHRLQNQKTHVAAETSAERRRPTASHGPIQSCLARDGPARLASAADRRRYARSRPAPQSLECAQTALVVESDSHFE